MPTKGKLEDSGNKLKGPQALEFKVGFEGKPTETIHVFAYAFDRQGKLLASAPVRNDAVKLTLTPEEARSARLFFAPQRPGVKAEKSITLDKLESLRAYEASWSFDIEKQAYELLPFPEYYWQWWFFCMCRVRGQVVKPVNLGGVLTDMPVCNARVHICEVDPFIWLIPRLPDPIVIRLRDELLRAIEFPHPIPIPDPPPFQFDPGVIDPSPLNLAKMNRAALSVSAGQLFSVPSSELNPQPEPPLPGRFGDVMLNPQPLPPSPDPFSKVELNPQPLPPRENSGAMQLLSLETRSALMSPSTQVVRQGLLDNVTLFRPYLCYWPWLWPWLCRCDEIAELTTDAHGRFDTTIWYWCFGDHPDLYFWVEYSIGGVWTTVYHPNPVCCYTYWDYACGSDVTIRVTDPRVTPCGDPPPDLDGLQVAVLSIGNNVSMSEIPVDSTAAAPLSGSATEGLANAASPFGGQLEPHVNFSRSALKALNITHYRWSYRQLTQGDGSTPLAVADTWHAMDRQVIRHYQVYNPITMTLTYPVFPLGPDPAYPGLNLFKIQPIDAPTGFPEDWVPVDAREDSASAFFLSYLTQGGDAALGAGKYELKFELFNTAGVTPAVVDLTATGIALKVPNVPAPFGSGTVTFDDADDHHRFKNGAGHTVAFRLVLRVDNIPTQAEIYQVYVDNPSNLAGPCGFINYANKHTSHAHLSFKAHHPHKFAMFNFVTVKGSTGGIAAASDSGQVNQGGTDAAGFANTPSTGLYSKDVHVSDLLDANGVSCTKAAFGETLHVDAMATDGWSLLEYLDSDGTPMAFALEP